MNTKIMEGLVGAKTNVDLVNTPMRVYRDARRRGDLATMERAMGYAGEFAEKAQEYKTEAKEGMKEEAEEIKENAKEEREKELEERIGKDTLEVSEEGRKLEEGLGKSDPKAMQAESLEGKNAAVKEPVWYTKTGEASQFAQGGSISVSI